jgi:hypothetical protein
MRHALGVLGVIAAGVLLAVSAAMNYRFGFSLGKTALDGQIYGMASAAADCFKALVPFFLFAAIRNRMWSQALAAALGGSLSPAIDDLALGHAALNRLTRPVMRSTRLTKGSARGCQACRGSARLIPQHRPAETVQSDISGIADQRL